MMQFSPSCLPQPTNRIAQVSEDGLGTGLPGGEDGEGSRSRDEAGEEHAVDAGC